MTAVNVYDRIALDSFANDHNPGMGIGDQILQLKKGHPSLDWNKVDLFLCNELSRPLVIKLNEKLYDFGNWGGDNDIFANIPLDSNWSQLVYKETINLTMNNVRKYAKEHSITDLDDGDTVRKIVERILEIELREKSNDYSKVVGLFNNDKGALVAYTPFGRENAFISKVSYDYQSLMNNFILSQKSH